MSTESTFVDVAFPLSGKSLPLDHGYQLFGAVSRLIPRLHQEASWGLHPVHGRRLGPGELQLLKSSLLTIRAPVTEIGTLLPLSGQTLDVAGHSTTVGIPRVYPLRPESSLRSRFVTIKSFVEPDSFVGAVRRQLDALGISAAAKIEAGPRRVLRVSNHTIVGFPVDVGGLTGDESTRLQASGVGGRRHMGAGVFLPLSAKA